MYMYMYVYVYHMSPHSFKQWPASIRFDPRAPDPEALNPEPRNPTPFTIHPTPYILHPTPYTLHPTLYTLKHAPRRRRTSLASIRADELELEEYEGIPHFSFGASSYAFSKGSAVLPTATQPLSRVKDKY